MKRLSGIMLLLTGMGCSDPQVSALQQLGANVKHNAQGEVKFVDLSGQVSLDEQGDLSRSGSRVTDAGLIHLAGLTQLEELWLQKTRITDDGLAHLAQLTSLKELWLLETRITDAGVAHLAGLTNLEE